MATTSSPSSLTPLFYRLFLLWIEPVTTTVGAYYAQFRKKDYLAMTDPSLAPNPVGPSKVEGIVLTQLANLYFLLALNEAFVLRATTDRHVWRVFLLGLLIADFGHLYSVHTMGLGIYWRFWEWNAMYWGNVGFTCCAALVRICFLLDVGLSSARRTRSKRS